MDSSPDRRGRTAAIRTFLIADVRGYTRFTAEHGDEAASRLAKRFAEVAGEGIGAWDGELVELRGDEALAVFDSARQALRCAVELSSAFTDETRSDPALPLGVGMGLDVGEAVPVGEGYRGAALNFAARLCAIAGAGEILASEALVRLAGPAEGLAFTTLEPQTFKGYDAPVAPVRVAGTAQADEAVAAAAPGPAPRPSTSGQPRLPAADREFLPPELDPIVPLAGRVKELRWLGWHWRRARHGHGRTIVLSGPPGIGKTRLAAELATIAHAAGATIAYRQASAGALGPELDALAGLPGPVLLVIDDLDAAAFTMARDLERLASTLTGRAALLVVTHRLEAPPAIIALAERLAPVEQRHVLGPLEPAAVRAIAALYAGRASGDLSLEELVVRTGGVPAAVHQVASQWARTAASRRLEASADRTAAGRQSLRSAEVALLEDVADLEAARELSRRYAMDRVDAGERATIRTICPYKGLAAFEATDAEFYFGRERLVAELIARFVGTAFLGVVGDSGSGKSSALLAGLLPALGGGVLPGSERWPQVILRPGEHPLAELGRSLARAFPDRDLPAGDPPAALAAATATLGPGERLVVVVDQFEEVFNATRDVAERSAFIDLLTAGHAGLKTIVAMRADHYGRCAAYPALARLIGANHVLVGPMSDVELVAAIEHPAERVALRVEPALTAALVADAGSEPGALSLLSTALLELWGSREAGRLTLRAYVTSGGLRGAIARLAEAAYAGLDPHQQVIARSILLRLAGPGEGSEVVRRRVPLSELDAERDPVVGGVLETLTKARLLTAGEGHVEVAHEALLREWPRLQGWLAEDAAGRAVRLHLLGAVHDWEERGREPGDLYRGARLAASLDWAADHPAELNAAERAFLDASRQASEREVERERRMNRRLRILLGGAAALLVLAVAAGGLAVLQERRASDEAQRAGQQRLLAEQQGALAQQSARDARSRELLASALAALGQDASLAKMLAVEATNVVATPSSQATDVLHQVLAADPIIARYTWPTNRPVDSLWTQLDPSGRLLVASGEGRGFNASTDSATSYLEVADATTGRVLWSWSGGDASATSGGGFIGPSWFSADGTQVIAGLYWTNPTTASPSGVALGAMIWDARTGTFERTIKLGPCGGEVTAVAGTRLLAWLPVSGPDGRTGCHWPADGQARVEVVDVASGVATVLSDRAGWSEGGTLSGSGRFAGFDVLEPGACGPQCWTSVVVDLDNANRRVFKLEGDPTSDAYARLLNQDGTLLLYGDQPSRAYSIADGPARPIATLPSTGGGGVAFDSTGHVFQTGIDGTLRRWDPNTGQVLATWPAIGGGRPSVAADGRTVLVSSAASSTAVLLDTGPRGELGGVQSCRFFTNAGSLKVSNGLAAFGESCPDGSIVTQVVDLKKLTLTSLPGWYSQDVAISPDGGLFVSQAFSGQSVFGPLNVASLRTGQVSVQLQGTCRWDYALATAPERQPGCAAYPQTPFPFLLRALRWSSDGRMIAAVDDNFDFTTHAVSVWDAQSGKLLFKSPIYPDKVAGSAVFTPDSTGLVISNFRPGLVETLSTATWRPLMTSQLDPSAVRVTSLVFIGFTPDGATILAAGSGGLGEDPTLIWLDAATLRLTRTVEHATGGVLKSAALSPDGSLVATGASDGFLRVWDAKTGGLVQQMHFPAQVQGVAFTDNLHLVVTPQTGDLLIMTLDPVELVNAVRTSLTRTFTSTECTTYDISPCPTLAQMKAGH